MSVTYIPNDHWLANTAINILGPILGGALQRQQQADENRKYNALFAEADKIINNRTAPTAQISTATHNTSVPGMAQNNFNPADNIPNQSDLNQVFNGLIASKRFNMLDREKAMSLFAPRMKSIEDQRQENLRNQTAQNIMSANDPFQQYNNVLGAATQGIVNPAIVSSAQRMAEFMNPNKLPTSIDNGRAISLFNFDPKSGQFSKQTEINKFLSPQDIAKQDYENKALNARIAEIDAQNRRTNAMNKPDDWRDKEALRYAMAKQSAIQSRLNDLREALKNPDLTPEEKQSAMQEIFNLNASASYWDEYISNNLNFPIYSTKDFLSAKSDNNNNANNQPGNNANNQPDNIGKYWLDGENFDVSSNYGYRPKHPITGQPANHYGIDLKTPENTQIKTASFQGFQHPKIVKVVNNHKGYGNFVDVEGKYYGRDVMFRFAHLNNVSAKEGQSLKPDDVIGLTGNTGQSTGAHLHLETFVKDKNGKYVRVDPNKFFDSTKDYESSHYSEQNKLKDDYYMNMFKNISPFDSSFNAYNDFPVLVNPEGGSISYSNFNKYADDLIRKGYTLNDIFESFKALGYGPGINSMLK